MIEHRDLDYWKGQIEKYDDKVNTILIDCKERIQISEKLLDGLRHFTEAIMCFIREFDQPKEFVKRYDEIEESKKYCKSQAKYRFISDFEENLNGSVGHQDFFEEYAERLFLKYYGVLIRIKELFRIEFSFSLFKDITKYPIDLDESFLSYYRLIIKTLSKNDLNNNLSGCDSFYIQKKKMIYVDGVLFYEYTLTNALDNNNKFDRFIAFSLLNIPEHYAIKARTKDRTVQFFGQTIEYQVIVGFKIAIRPCEFDKLASIMGFNYRFSRTKEYWNLMDYLELSHKTLNQIVEYSDIEFERFVSGVFSASKETMLFKLLNRCRLFLQSNEIVGKNALRYLLFKMNNTLLANQMPKDEDDCLSSINLSKRIYGFDKLPLSTCPIRHEPSMRDLLSVYDFSKHKAEIMARTISAASVDASCIYVAQDRIDIEGIDDLVSEYNENFKKPSLRSRKILRQGKYLYLNENELNTYTALTKLIAYSNTINFSDYKNFIESQIINKGFSFTDANKEKALKCMYEKSSIFAVYGAAGAGKSYFANYVLKAMEDVVKVCIASTNPAVENMKRRFDDNSATYMTVYKFINDYEPSSNIDLLVIDECSTVSTKEICEIMQKVSPKLILLLGDTYQIKPISFGNWFGLLRRFLRKDCYVDLNNQYRCNSETLLGFWDEVRRLGKNIQELLSMNEISHKYDETIFNKNDQDEIILCLNYDGLYGINNLNKILQKNNPNKEYRWKQYRFKIGDPIIFNETTAYRGVFYNNLKGTIIDIAETKDEFVFTVKLKRVVNPFVCSSNNVTYIKTENEETIVSFEVSKYGEDYYDDDTRGNTRIPFQIAYALSIHKAQGLEYNSVKIIISNEVEENISHNVFYTAITRARNLLTIYWTPESEEKIVKNFYMENCDNDAVILSAKYPDLQLV